MIQVTEVSKIYGSHIAVDEISFQVEEGHIYGLLGPNGAGKSTTMNMITGYIAPTEGTITINGFDIGMEPMKAKKCIGYLPEIPPLYPDMYVYEYLNFVAKLKKVAKEERTKQIEEVMSKTGVKDVEKRLIKNLSKGYKQRVGIAQALLGNPEVIILDEPTVGLDPEQIIEIRQLIKGLKEKHTVILSSHILSEISAVCDDVLMIAHGKVVAMDTTEHLLKMNQGGQKLEIIAKGTADKIEEVLKQLNTIASFSLKKTEDVTCTYEIIANEGEDIREELSFALADARILIMEMKVSAASLEDIYLDLIQKADEEEKCEDEEEDFEEVESEKDSECEEEVSEDAEEVQENEETEQEEKETSAEKEEK